MQGPLVDAVLSFYFGIDGKTEFRPIATRDQSWTLGRVARVYRGDRALEVVRLAGAIIATYDAIQAAHPGLPFGGYFALGVCNDANALIELAMQGETSLYPLTRDATLFPADTEVGTLARRLPVDGRPGEPTDVRRVLTTLPVDDLAALPDDVAYTITKAINDDADRVRGLHASLADYEPSRAWLNLGAALHPGAARYYREKGWLR